MLGWGREDGRGYSAGSHLSLSIACAGSHLSLSIVRVPTCHCLLVVRVPTCHCPLATAGSVLLPSAATRTAWVAVSLIVRSRVLICHCRPLLRPGTLAAVVLVLGPHHFAAHRDKRPPSPFRTVRPPAPLRLKTWHPHPCSPLPFPPTPDWDCARLSSNVPGAAERAPILPRYPLRILTQRHSPNPRVCSFPTRSRPTLPLQSPRHA